MVIRSHMCSVNFIFLSDRFLVTAAHYCIHSSRSQVYRISVGAHTKVSEGETYSVHQFFVHPNYTATPFEKLENDIALIELEKPIHFNQNTSIIEINREFSEGNTEAFVLGQKSGFYKMFKFYFAFQTRGIVF